MNKPEPGSFADKLALGTSPESEYADFAEPIRASKNGTVPTHRNTLQRVK